MPARSWPDASARSLEEGAALGLVTRPVRVKVVGGGHERHPDQSNVSALKLLELQLRSVVSGMGQTWAIAFDGPATPRKATDADGRAGSGARAADQRGGAAVPRRRRAARSRSSTRR